MPTPSLRQARLVRLAAVLAVCAVATLGLAGPAAADVTVHPTVFSPGDDGWLTFRVSNGGRAALTTRVEVFLPEADPVGSVAVRPVPGWTVTIVKRRYDSMMKTGRLSELVEYVAQITWTALDRASAIQSDEFQEFPVLIGHLPERDRLIFRTIQGFSDGSVIDWYETASDHRTLAYPAPVLSRATSRPAGSGGAGVDTAGPAAGPATAGALPALPAVAALLALGASAAALAMSAFALVRARRR
ncbi:MAG TPA: YcnI family protein [Micromonosporaceae bacterium]